MPRSGPRPPSPATASSSPSEDGNVYIFDLAEKFGPVTACDLGEPLLSTPAFADGRIYFRGKDAVLRRRRREQVRMTRKRRQIILALARTAGPRTRTTTRPFSDFLQPTHRRPRRRPPRPQWPSPRTPPLDLAAVDRIVAGIGRERRCAMPILQAVQAHYHYLPLPGAGPPLRDHRDFAGADRGRRHLLLAVPPHAGRPAPRQRLPRHRLPRRRRGESHRGGPPAPAAGRRGGHRLRQTVHRAESRLPRLLLAGAGHAH